MLGVDDDMRREMAEDERLAVALDKGATMPARAHRWDAGLDLAANEDAVIPPHGWESVGTGVHVGIPQGTVALLEPVLVERLGETERGAGGFGSTGR
jgi:dUTPase